MSRPGQGHLHMCLNSCIVYLICDCHALLGFLSSGVLEMSVEVIRRDATELFLYHLNYIFGS